MRAMRYAEAIREAHEQLMEADARVFLIGQGLWSPWYAGTSLKDLDKRFGRHRVIDSPVAENAVTGAAIGAAIAGMRPIVFHPRMDFMLLATDPIINQAANWSYVFNGQGHVPVTIRAVINRRGEQGAQHSQALQGMFAHVPGLKVVLPSTPFDAKGLLVAAVRDPNPVLYIDDRVLYDQTGHVPEQLYETPIGKAAVRQKGTDVTIVATSEMATRVTALRWEFERRSIHPEIIDLRSIKPWDQHCVLESVRKTGRLLVVDGTWRSFGVAAEIAATVAEEAHQWLRAPVKRLCLPDIPAPASSALEDAYYISDDRILQVAGELVAFPTTSGVCFSPRSFAAA